MNRESINPWNWGLKWSMDQAELVSGVSRYLHFSGQVALEPDPDSEMGVTVVSPGDMRGQIESALSNIDQILAKASMKRSQILSLRFFTTDVDAFLKNYDVYVEWIGRVGTRPPQTLLGVQRLVFPELLIEIEALAGE